MAKARKLPSGSWNCKAYSHTEKVLDPETGKTKKKRIYESFTSDTPGSAGRREVELAAANFQMEKSSRVKKKKQETGNLTLTEAIDKYVETRISLNRSPTTISGYKCIQRNAFQDLMDMKLKDMDEGILQDAINAEALRPSRRVNCTKQKPISPKLVKNEWGLLTAVLNKYLGSNIINTKNIELPEITPRFVELPQAADVLNMVKGTDIELPVLLAAWLSFSMSEVRGLTKSKSISGDHIMIREVVVLVDGKPVRKDMAKNPTRNRRHRIPPYIQGLIEKVDGDVLVPMAGRTLYRRWIQLQKDNGMTPITFHDLRHLNASVMALLRIPDKYAQERGGWKSDVVMKKVYTQTFSEDRVRVDDTVDEFFEDILDPESDGIDRAKYKAWLTLYDRTDSALSKKQFKKFMQHEMQHEKKKAL